MTAHTTQEIMEAVNGLRAEVKGVANPERMEKMNATLDTLEASNQKAVAAQTASDQKQLELEEKLAGLEVELARGITTQGKSNYQELPEYKALQAFCVGGDKGLERLEEEVKNALRTDIDPQGGYLVPRELDNVIVKKITEISPVRSVARVRTTAGKTLDVPVRATIPDASYEGEGESGGDSNSTYENETLTPYRLTFTAPITMDMLMDSAFDMESEIMADAAEAFSYKEGNKFILGTGVKQPSGFLADPRVAGSFMQSNVSGKLTAEDIIRVTGNLKTGYNPVFMMNRRTLASLRTEKSTTGEFIWQPGVNGVVQSTIAGEAYVIANDMPDIASGALAVAYGDFLRGYTILDRTGLSVIRDEITQKKKAIVEFTMNRWNTGQVVLPEAITGIAVKA